MHTDTHIISMLMDVFLMNLQLWFSMLPLFSSTFANIQFWVHLFRKKTFRSKWHEFFLARCNSNHQPKVLKHWRKCQSIQIQKHYSCWVHNASCLANAKCVRWDVRRTVVDYSRQWTKRVLDHFRHAHFYKMADRSWKSWRARSGLGPASSSTRCNVLLRTTVVCSPSVHQSSPTSEPKALVHRLLYKEFSTQLTTCWVSACTPRPLPVLQEGSRCTPSWWQHARPAMTQPLLLLTSYLVDWCDHQCMTQEPRTCAKCRVRGGTSWMIGGR